MNNLRSATHGVLACLLCSLLSCSDVYQPSGTRYDRYGNTGINSVQNPNANAPALTPGRYLQTISNSTAFFLNYPGIEDRPYRILSDYVDVKVVSTKGPYVKVEVVDTGEVGYVPSIMLGEKRSRVNLPATPRDNDADAVPDISPDLIDPSRPGL